MRHARPEALDELETLLVSLRALGVLKEKSRGVFYKGGQAFLHFHEDPAGLFADIRAGKDFDRHRVSSAKERAAFLKVARAALNDGAKRA
jgi:hypothetical protein